jgi:hypothetical protein
MEKLLLTYGLANYQILIPLPCAIPIPNCEYYQFYLAGQHHHIEFPVGVIRPKLKETENVAGCGILINPNDKLAIFFTFNGILIRSILIFYKLHIFTWIYYILIIIIPKKLFQIANFLLIRRLIIWSQLSNAGMKCLWRQISDTIRPNPLNTTSKNALGWDWNGFEKNVWHF